MIPKLEPPKLSHSEKFSEEFQDFITACLKKDASERPSAAELLRHQFIVKNASKTILQELLSECLPKVDQWRKETKSPIATRKSKSHVNHSVFSM